MQEVRSSEMAIFDVYLCTLKFWYIMHIRDDICQIYLQKLPERVWEIC